MNTADLKTIIRDVDFKVSNHQSLLTVTNPYALLFYAYRDKHIRIIKDLKGYTVISRTNPPFWWIKE